MGAMLWYGACCTLNLDNAPSCLEMRCARPPSPLEMKKNTGQSLGTRVHSLARIACRRGMRIMPSNSLVEEGFALLTSWLTPGRVSLHARGTQGA